MLLFLGLKCPHFFRLILKNIELMSNFIRSQNNAPEDFPWFAREGFDMSILLDGYVVEESGVIVKDYNVGTGKNLILQRFEKERIRTY